MGSPVYSSLIEIFESIPVKLEYSSKYLLQSIPVKLEYSSLFQSNGISPSVYSSQKSIPIKKRISFSLFQSNSRVKRVSSSLFQSNGRVKRVSSSLFQSTNEIQENVPKISCAVTTSSRWYMLSQHKLSFNTKIYMHLSIYKTRQFSSTRPYHHTNTGSHPNAAVKNGRAQSVRVWETRLEACVLSFFCFFFYSLANEYQSPAPIRP